MSRLRKAQLRRLTIKVGRLRPVVDVSNEDSVKKMIGDCQQKFGSVDILVNNAGIFPPAPVAQMTEEDFEKVMHVNLRSVFLTTKFTSEVMKQQGNGGHIINITSIDALHPSMIGLAHYDASKHGVWGFTKNSALELANDKIWVNAIAPGGIQTPGVEAMQAQTKLPEGVDPKQMVEAFLSKIPMHRMGQPEEIGNVALFLASDLIELHDRRANSGRRRGSTELMSSDYYISAGWWYSLVVIMLLYAVIEAWHMRSDHIVKFREAVIWTIVYVSLGLLYAVPLFFWVGSQAGSEYLAAFFTEKALSLDNLFVFGLIFAAFKLPKKLERRVLNYGVVGAIFFRLIFIIAGIAILERFEWVSIIFGLILLRAAWHAYNDALGKSKEQEITETRTWKILSSVLPFTHHYSGHKLTERTNKGKLVLTMLAAVIIMIELTDILFAVDSVPAVLAISTNRFIAYSSNIFALLGLRALYFVYAEVADRFWALKWGISVILGWISIKLILVPFHVHIPHLLNLGVILGIIGLSIILSNTYPQPKTR